MKLADHLSQKKSSIVDSWLNLLFESYPPETAGFLKREKDRFNNPVGYQLSQGIKGLYDALLMGMETAQVLSSLDDILRIKAVQDASPSQALAFIFLLKKVIREQLANELREEQLAQEMLELESRIDGLGLLGFEVYLKHREKLFEIRINEVKNRVSGLLRRTGVSLDNPQPEAKVERPT